VPSSNLRDVLAGSGRIAKEDQPKEPKMKVDGTLNINTLITAGSLLVSGALAYATLDKRISLLEQQTAAAVQIAAERSTEIKDALRDVKSEVKELRTVVTKQQGVPK
jgi:hypothetical protein